MRWFTITWLAFVGAAVILQETYVNSAPSPHQEDMWKTLLELDRMYSSIARPRFGKRSGHMMKNALDGSDYDGQNQDGDEGDYYSKRR